MLQFKVPQNVGIEDKIVGPLSLRQLITLAVGIGISYVLFAILTKFYETNTLEYIVIAIPALISAAMALIRINDVTFSKFMLLTFEYNLKPKRRLWDHRGIASLVSPDLSESATALASKPADTAAGAKKAVNLRELTQVLDSGGFQHVQAPAHNDLDSAKDDDLMATAYFKNKESPTQNMYWRTQESQKKRLDLLAKVPATRKEAARVAAAATGSAPARLAPVTPARPAPTPTVKPAPLGKAPATPPVSSPRPTPAAPTPDGAPQKRKRRRKRKGAVAAPARDASPVNTLQPSRPTPPSAPSKPAPAKPVNAAPTPPKEAAPTPPQPKPSTPGPYGEIEFRELQRGDIDINLD